MKHVLLAIVLAFGLTSFAHAEGRLALVIGNGTYAHANVLPNADDDADAMAQKFMALDFLVSSIIDADEAELRAAIAEFVEDAKGAELIAVYYAGHGVMTNGDDMLLPIDFDPSRKSAALANAVALGGILRSLEATGATVMAFIDTNRTSAFEGNKATGTAGFLPAENSGGVVVSYSTSPGGIALDGKDKHSPYTAALLKNLGAPGVEIGKTLSLVRAEVFQATNGEQAPWDLNTLKQPLILKPQ